jgi:hypothetical protein
MPKAYKYRIHPAIGVARVGESDESFDGPEFPDQDFQPSDGKGYWDVSKKIRRQAAVFRLYEYEYANTAEAYKVKGKPTRVREITMDMVKFGWTVKLANLKSWDKNGINTVPINPPEQELNTKNRSTILVKGKFDNGSDKADVTLGALSTDSIGRLRVLAGHGISDSPGLQPLNITSYVKNNGWYDDIADGPITVKIDFKSFDAKHLPPTGHIIEEVESAWVVTAAPDYAHAIEPIVSLYDMAYSIAVDHLNWPSKFKPSFTNDIYPILHKTGMMHWTSKLLQQIYAIKQHHFEEATFGDAAFRKVGADRFKLLMDNRGPTAMKTRMDVFMRLRNPNDPADKTYPGMTMPRLNADNDDKKKVALTQRQYKQLKMWGVGLFDADWDDISRLKDLPPEDHEPVALDQAHMRSMVAGAFFPGIEVGQEVSETTTWKTPFRIDVTKGAGFLTKSLAMPWQADFAACAAEQGGDEWWPSHRPITVLPDTEKVYDLAKFKEWAGTDKLDMVTRWKKLGFLVKRPGSDVMYVEQKAPPP